MRDPEMVSFPRNNGKRSPEKVESGESAGFVAAAASGVHGQILGAYRTSDGMNQTSMVPGVVYESYNMVPGVVYESR